MPYPTQSYVERPFYQPRYVGDTTRLGSIYSQGGRDLALIDLQRGRTSAETMERLSSILSGTLEGVRGDKAAKAAVALRRLEKQEEREFTAEQKKLERDERAAERKADKAARKESDDRSAARWMVDNTKPGVVDDALAKFAGQFPELAGRFAPQMTLPARPVPGAVGAMGPQEPTGRAELFESPDDARANTALTAQRERWAAEDKRAGVDDSRAERALNATIENQEAMRRISQQQADTSRMQAETTRNRYTGGGVDTSKMPAPLVNALDRSILTITATKRGPILALAHRLADEGNVNELKSVIKQAAIEGENVDTKNQVLGRQATMAALADARNVLQAMKKAGVPSNILTGTAEDIARKLGTSTDTRYVEFSNALQDALISYRRAATGVAFSEREAADYTRMFPNYRQTMPVNEAAISGLERAMRTHDRQYWEHKLGPDGAKAVIGDFGATTAAPAATAPVKILSITPVPKR